MTPGMIGSQFLGAIPDVSGISPDSFLSFPQVAHCCVKDAHPPEMAVSAGEVSPSGL